MLQELRESITPPLTRSALAEHIHRSPNYVLKAESLTFPNVPPALLNFYTRELNYPPSLLVSQYRDAQRKRREHWLSYWRVMPAPPVMEGAGSGSFTHAWQSQYPPYHSPTEYAISQGLCIPAAAVYNIQHRAKIASSILVALEDLREYCLDGRVFADTHLTADEVDQVLSLIAHYKGLSESREVA